MHIRKIFVHIIGRQCVGEVADQCYRLVAFSNLYVLDFVNSIVFS